MTKPLAPDSLFYRTNVFLTSEKRSPLNSDQRPSMVTPTNWTYTKIHSSNDQNHTHSIFNHTHYNLLRCYKNKRSPAAVNVSTSSFIILSILVHTRTASSSIDFVTVQRPCWPLFIKRLTIFVPDCEEHARRWRLLYREPLHCKVHHRKLFLQDVLARIDECETATDVDNSVNILVAIRWVGQGMGCS